MTFDELLRISPQLGENRRTSKWVRWSGVILLVLAVNSATRADWLGAAIFAVMGVHMWTRFGCMQWLLRKLMRGVTHAELELDERGIRGVIESHTSGMKRPEIQRLGYAWRQLRKVVRLPEYLYLEFHGGGGAIIPVTAFAEPDDLRQCEAWAQNGLAQGRTKAP